MGLGDRKIQRAALKKKFKDMRKDHPELRGMTFASFQKMWKVAGIQQHNHAVEANPEVDSAFEEMFEDEVIEDEDHADQ